MTLAVAGPLLQSEDMAIMAGASSDARDGEGGIARDATADADADERR